MARTLSEAPADAWIPLQYAHQFIGKKQPTIYEWQRKGKLEIRETPDGMIVQIGELRRAESSQRIGRPRVTNTPSVSASHESPE